MEKDEALLKDLLDSFVAGSTGPALFGLTDSHITELLKERDRLQALITKLGERKHNREELVLKLQKSREVRENLSAGIEHAVKVTETGSPISPRDVGGKFTSPRGNQPCLR